MKITGVDKSLVIGGNNYSDRDQQITKKTTHEYNIRKDDLQKISLFNSKEAFHSKMVNRKVVRVVRFIKSPDSELNFSERKEAQNFVTWSGIFNSYRQEEALVRHSGLICITIKRYTEEQYFRYAYLMKDPYTCILFKNNITEELHIVVKVDINSLNEHEQCYYQLVNYFFNMYKFDIDQFDDSGKDVTSLCHLPCDPLIYFKQTSSRFNIVFRPGHNQKVLNTPTIDKRLTKAYVKQIKFEALVVDVLGASILEKNVIFGRLAQKLTLKEDTVRKKLTSLSKKFIEYHNIKYKLLETSHGKKEFYQLTIVD